MTLNVLNQVVEVVLQRKSEALNKNPQFQLLIEKTNALEKARDDQEKINNLLLKEYEKTKNREA